MYNKNSINILCPTPPPIAKNFFDLLKIGLGGNYYKLFIDPMLLLYIVIDSWLGFTLVNISNGIFADFANKQIVLWKITAIIFLPLVTNVINILFDNIFLKKKLYIVNNILDYIKNTFSNAPHDFHDKYSISEKYHCFTSSIWGFDSIFEVIISMCSSFIKIIIISISISITNYYIGLLIIVSNIILLLLMPKINNYMNILKDSNAHKKFYTDAYYDTLISDENRVNPILNNIQQSNINNSLHQIVSKYSNMNKIYKIRNSIRGFIKNIFLSAILIVAFYQEKYNYIMIILLNKNIIFGFSDFYEDFKKTENSNKKNTEDLIEMLEFLELYYKSNLIKNPIINNNNINPNNLILENMNYKFYYENKLVKRLLSNNLILDFTSEKKIILISGKTGSGKSLFTKVLSGQLDKNEYSLLNDGTDINGFSSMRFNRIIMNQKISEEYTYNGSVQLTLEKLYPQSKNWNEISDFLKIFGISNKINTESLDSKFSDKLSGGERQRVALSSMMWKVLKTNPSFIIIDEPEKGIDEETMIDIMDWILIVYKKIIFLITHNETIKRKYHNQIQSIIKYKNKDEDEIDTEIYQEFI